MVVWVRNFQTAVVFSESLLKLHCTLFMHLLGAAKYDVNVVCVDTKSIQALNRRYRAVDAPTDILSFPYHEVCTCHQFCKHTFTLTIQKLQPGELPPVHHEWDSNLGDIILGMPIIQAACILDHTTLKDRVPVILAHGLCHLVGYHHEDPTNLRLVT